MTLLELLNIETGAPVETLRRIIATGPRRYKVYQIPKKSGGLRTIAHPARELKAIQYVVLKEILDNIAVSEIATAYVKGRGILKNAELHLTQKWILKLDFRNFFSSIVPSDWNRIVRRTAELKEFADDNGLFHQILFWGAGGKEPYCLSIGAPTSPSVSNLACFQLDNWLSKTAGDLGVTVSRYADDITVSGEQPKELLQFDRLLQGALRRNKGLKLQMNDEKRGLYGPGERRMVTGLILTPDGQISMGRERKREISTLVHRYSLGISDNATIMRTKGLLAFAISVEPKFFTSMQNKYGQELLTAILHSMPQHDDFIDLM